MFKLTCFAPIEPKQLEQALRGICFKPVKKGFEWTMDGTTFRIEPFENQPRGAMKAYRVTFDCDFPGGMYLFDLSLGCLGTLVTGIEYVLEHPKMNNSDWMKDLNKRQSYKKIDARGLFMKNGISIVVINHAITLKLHSRKNQKLILMDALKKIDVIREELEELVPVDFDLFSYPQEEIA